MTSCKKANVMENPYGSTFCHLLSSIYANLAQGQISHPLDSLTQ